MEEIECEEGVKDNFKKVFYPGSVAIIGASADEKKMGYLCIESLIKSSFKGKIYPINKNEKEILGIPAYPFVESVPNKVDLAIIVIPAKFVPLLIKECGKKGVKGVVIVSGGFKEAGEEGRELEEEIKRVALEYQIKIIGPNTFGFVNTYAALNASFSPVLSELKRGEISVLSQSGGVCHIISYEAMDDGEGVGFSKIIGVGNRTNIDFADILLYLENDGTTKVIAMYIEGVDDGRRLIEVAKRVSRKKPIVALKAGKTEMDDKALSHTGSLSGSYKTYEKAFQQIGIVTVDNCTELLDAAKILAFTFSHQHEYGNKKKGGVAIVSTQAGPAIIIADVCKKEGLELVKFSEKTTEKLKKLLPPLTFLANPVDTAFVYDVERKKEIIREVLGDESTTLLILFHLYHPHIEFPVEEVISLAKGYSEKQIIVCMNAPREKMKRERERLQKEKIPVYPTPERTAKAATALFKCTFFYKKNLQ